MPLSHSGIRPRDLLLRRLPLELIHTICSMSEHFATGFGHYSASLGRRQAATKLLRRLDLVLIIWCSSSSISKHKSMIGMAPTAEPTYSSRRAKSELKHGLPMSSARKRVRLREELIRQRELLRAEWNLSVVPLDEPVPCPDLADQASTDFEQSLAIEVKVRVITKLKRIEHALLMMRTKAYGCCRQCHKAIPDARLMVQPEALFCVPCLALVESRTVRN